MSIKSLGIRVSIAILLLLCQYPTGAQDLFDLPSVICTHQRVDLVSKVKDQNSYFWHFCAGDLTKDPVTSEIRGMSGATPSTSKVKLVKTDMGYYAFSIRTGGILVRGEYDTDMNFITYHDLGSNGGVMPPIVTAIDIMKDGTGKYFGIVVGYDPVDDEGSVVRIDFGTDIRNNNPIYANFGKNQTMLRPKDVVLVNENGNYSAYTVNAFTNSLGRIDFGSDFYNNPSVTDLGSTFSFSNPAAMVAFEDAGNKYLMVTNLRAGGLVLVNFGNNWGNTPQANFLGTQGGVNSAPVDISVIKDCGRIHFVVLNSSTFQPITITYTGNFYNMSTRVWAAGSGSSFPTTISEIYRTGGRVRCVEYDDATAYSHTFDTCNKSFDFQISTDEDPSFVKYYDPGTYTIYLVINEGQPDEYVYCKTFDVQAAPSITASDDTLICVGDTATLEAVVGGAKSYIWDPNYNISETEMTKTLVWPDTSVYYTCFISLQNGCIIDTTILVDVSQVHADAGPDKTVYDASRILLGGPNTSGSDTGTYFYTWTPADEALDADKPYTEVLPAGSKDFVLTVTNDYGCIARDTTKVWVICDDIHLPNAFQPLDATGKVTHFGLLNRAIYQLNYFRIYNRFGNLVFEAKETTDEWDGTVNGVLMPQDNYVWEVDGICRDGFHMHRTGTVLLLR